MCLVINDAIKQQNVARNHIGAIVTHYLGDGRQSCTACLVRNGELQGADFI